MVKNVLSLALCLLGVQGFAQLVNQGASITVMPGAKLLVETNVLNQSNGLIDIRGEVEVTGDFTNEAKFTTTDGSLLKFSGTAESAFLSSGDTVRHLEISKSNAHVVLEDDLTVLTTLLFSGSTNRLRTGDHELFLREASISGTQSARYIATDGLGSVHRNVAQNGTITYPVGDVTNYSPLSNAITADAYSNASLAVRVVDAAHPQKPADAGDFLSRYWQVALSGTATNYENDWTGTFAASDITGQDTKIKSAMYEGTDWKYGNNGVQGLTISGTTTAQSAGLTGTNFFGRLDLKVFLQGAYNASTGLMSTTLNNLNLIPLTSPYTDAPATVSSIPSGVTDWIKIEFRSASNPATVLARVSAFLKNDGSIVGLNGTSLPSIKDAEETGFAAIFHRNHLPIRTPIAINAVTPTAYDFSTGMNQAYVNPSIATNGPMRLISGANNKHVMWGGNANGNANIRYTGLQNDNQIIVGALGGNILLVLNNVYHNADLNLNGNVRYTGLQNDNQVLVNSIGGNILAVLTNHL